jgi:type I restriction enzyme S subunit
VKTVEFGTLFRFIRNGLNVRQDKSGDGLPITRIETISDATVDATRVGFARLQEADCCEWLLETGDILFSHINSVEHVGKCAVYRGTPEKLVHGMNLLCLRSDPAKILPEFAKYLMRGTEFRTRLSNFINKAVNQASVSIGNLKTIPVTVPPLPEQRRIAEVLDRAEALRAKRRAALAQLDSLTQAIFLELFGDPMMNPKGWETCLLEDVAKKITDGTHKTPAYKNSGIEFLSAKDLKDGGIAWGTEKFISQDEHRDLVRRCNPELGDILLAKSGSLGSVAIIDRSHQFSLFESLCLIKHDRDRIDGQFLTGLLRVPSMLAHLLGKNKGVAIKHLHLIDVRNLRIPLPPLPLQREFARHVTAVEALKTSHRASLTELDALFASLQHRAFRGEL